MLLLQFLKLGPSKGNLQTLKWQFITIVLDIYFGIDRNSLEEPVSSWSTQKAKKRHFIFDG